jgi:hypothetical protein
MGTSGAAGDADGTAGRLSFEAWLWWKVEVILQFSIFIMWRLWQRG